jgi:hypothetical protein
MVTGSKRSTPLLCWLTKGKKNRIIIPIGKMEKKKPFCNFQDIPPRNPKLQRQQKKQQLIHSLTSNGNQSTKQRVQRQL